MAEKNVLGMIATWLLIIGGINWGLSIFNINLVTLLATAINQGSIVSTVIYALIGIAALYKAAVKLGMIDWK